MREVCTQFCLSLMREVGKTNNVNFYKQSMFIILYIIVSFVRNKFLYIHQGQIQDFVLGGTKVGEGSGDRLRFPVGPGGQSPLVFAVTYINHYAYYYKYSTGECFSSSS
jgi:hypothetical protein